MIIQRAELESVLKTDRILLFGRRKTGKTFYVLLKKKNWDYAIVTAKNEVLADDTPMDMRSFLKYASKTDKLIIDEFHRADQLLFDYIQAHKLPEKLVLITSTLHFFKQLPHYSKIFGILPEFRVGLISPMDIVRDADLSAFSLEDLLFWQEPTQVGKKLEEILQTSKYFVQELVGEVLLEEDVAVHEKMRGLLLATAGGTTKLTEIAGKLAKKKIIERAETGLITPYLSLAIKLGLIERIPIFKTKRGAYRHVSPLTDLFYYLEDRYAFFEREPPLKFLQKVIKERISFYVERFVERFFSEAYGLTPEKSLNPEVDVLLLRFKKPAIVAEVKWTDRLDRREVQRIERMLSHFRGARKILFVKDKTGVPETKLEVMDPEDLREIARSATR